MKNSLFSVLAMALAALALVFSYQAKSKVKIAFVDTNRLMTAFKEANKANGEIKAEDDKWKANLKVMNDSLKSFMDSMTVKFDESPLSKRKELQDELAMRNQQINNYTAFQNRKLQEEAGKKLAVVFEKINAYMKEYGKREGYQIVFGTSNGSILYGEGSTLDITNDVIRELNKRYE